MSRPETHTLRGTWLVRAFGPPLFLAACGSGTPSGEAPAGPSATPSTAIAAPIASEDPVERSVIDAILASCASTPPDLVGLTGPEVIARRGEPQTRLADRWLYTGPKLGRPEGMRTQTFVALVFVDGKMSVQCEATFSTGPVVPD
jgi:hypothetical protein